MSLGQNYQRQEWQVNNQKVTACKEKKISAVAKNEFFLNCIRKNYFWNENVNAVPFGPFSQNGEKMSFLE